MYSSAVLASLLLLPFAFTAPAPPQLTIENASEKTYQCVPASDERLSSLNSEDCQDITSTLEARLNSQEWRQYPENTWAFHSTSANACHLGLFCTNWKTADSKKVQTAAVLLQNSTASHCGSSAAVTQNVIAPRPLYSWAPSPSPVLGEPNYCGFFLMTGKYFESSLGQLGEWKKSLSNWQVADNVASVALGRDPVYTLD